MEVLLLILVALVTVAFAETSENKFLQRIGNELSSDEKKVNENFLLQDYRNILASMERDDSDSNAFQLHRRDSVNAQRGAGNQALSDIETKRGEKDKKWINNWIKQWLKTKSEKTARIQANTTKKEKDLFVMDSNRMKDREETKKEVAGMRLPLILRKKDELKKYNVEKTLSVADIMPYVPSWWKDRIGHTKRDQKGFLPWRNNWEGHDQQIPLAWRKHWEEGHQQGRGDEQIQMSRNDGLGERIFNNRNGGSREGRRFNHRGREVSVTANTEETQTHDDVTASLQRHDDVTASLQRQIKDAYAELARQLTEAEKLSGNQYGGAVIPAGLMHEELRDDKMKIINTNKRNEKEEVEEDDDDVDVSANEGRKGEKEEWKKGEYPDPFAVDDLYNTKKLSIAEDARAAWIKHADDLYKRRTT